MIKKKIKQKSLSSIEIQSLGQRRKDRIGMNTALGGERQAAGNIVIYMLDQAIMEI